MKDLYRQYMVMWFGSTRSSIHPASLHFTHLARKTSATISHYPYQSITALILRQGWGRNPAGPICTPTPPTANDGSMSCLFAFLPHAISFAGLHSAPVPSLNLSDTSQQCYSSITVKLPAVAPISLDLTKLYQP